MMLYWRESYFRDLKEAAEAVSQRWPLYADYCVKQEKGLRSLGFAALAEFIEQMKRSSRLDQQHFVSWLLFFANERDGNHLLIPHPLRKQIVEPTLREWVETDPDNPEPHRLLGGQEHLERALELDPGDQIARKQLIIQLLSRIAYATHELPQGYLGSVPDDLDTLDRVEALLSGLLDDELCLAYAQAVAEERAAISKYISRSTGSMVQ